MRLELKMICLYDYSVCIEQVENAKDNPCE
jgi:hypothetical protein